LSEEKIYKITIRMDRKLYERLWNLRKSLKARTWAELLDKLTQGYNNEVEEVYWI